MATPLHALLAACAAFCSLVTAQALPRSVPAEDRILVCNQAEHTVSIYSASEREELAVLPTGRGPHEVAVTPDGRLAVVTDYGDQQPGHSLTIVDIAAQRVVRTIDLAQRERPGKFYLRPHGVQCLDDTRVIVTSEAARRLLLVDIERGVLRTLTTPQSTMHMVSATRDGRHAVGSSVRDGSVVYFELAAEHAQDAPPRAPIATGKGAEGLAVHPRTGDA